MEWGIWMVRAVIRSGTDWQARGTALHRARQMLHDSSYLYWLRLAHAGAAAAEAALNARMIAAPFGVPSPVQASQPELAR
jgi:hypothetical protein